MSIQYTVQYGDRYKDRELSTGLATKEISRDLGLPGYGVQAHFFAENFEKQVYFVNIHFAKFYGAQMATLQKLLNKL